MQGHKNGCETAGLRGVETVRTSSVGRARLSLFVAVGYGWVFVMESPDKADSEAYIRFLDRLCELVGKVQTIDDNAGYHTSDRSSDPIDDNAGRLRRIATLPYTPNDNAAEPQIRGIKAAMSNVGLDSVGAISGELKWCFKNGLINPVKFHDYAIVDSPRISPRKAAGIKKRLGPGEHFVYVKRGDAGRGDRPADHQGASGGGRQDTPSRKARNASPHTGQLGHSGQLSCEASSDTACGIGRHTAPAVRIVHNSGTAGS